MACADKDPVGFGRGGAGRNESGEDDIGGTYVKHSALAMGEHKENYSEISICTQS